MTKNASQIKAALPALAGIALLLIAAGARPQGSTDVALSQAHFNGLTRIAATASVPLTGLDAAHIVITKPDRAVVPAGKITGVAVTDTGFTVTINADQFARITSEGTTIATQAFGAFKASPPVKVQRPGEPAANGHIIGTSAGLDEGWNTIRTDPSFVDPVTGERGLYKMEDVTPDRDEKNQPISWNDGRIATPAHKSKTMLMLLVEFPDRLAANADAPYKDAAPYLEFLQGMVEWYARSAYGQLHFSLASPQVAKKLGWIMMDKNAVDYKWGGSTATMFAYIREASQKAYDKWGIKADDYDLLVVMPAMGKAGLRNGPANINRDPTDSEQPNVTQVAYYDKDKKPHSIDTAITAGNDLFRWGYRWAIHESGHTFGIPDLYMYGPEIGTTKVGIFFYCGGWDMMGNIAGHSTDFLAWHKWKLRWIRDDQVDVVSQSNPQPTRHYVTPVETPGGTKIVVVPTSLSTAYVAEFRTKLGVNALDSRGKYTGVLIYRIDAAISGARGSNHTGQIISKKYYNSPAVGGPKNLTGLWRPFDNGLDGYDSPDCCWQPGDVFSDPANGVTIKVDEITHYNSADHDNSPYTADDVAAISVTKTRNVQLFRNVVLSNAQLKNLTDLTFETNIELQEKIPNANAGRSGGGNFTYIREDSYLRPASLVITTANGAVIPADKIVRIVVNQESVQVTLAKGAFASDAEAAGATVATKAYYNFAAGAAVGMNIQK